MTWVATSGGARLDDVAEGVGQHAQPVVRGLHSFTSQLNLSALYGIGGVRKGLCSPCEAGVRRCVGCVGRFFVSETSSS